MAFFLRPPGELSLPERLGELGRARRRALLSTALFWLLASATALLTLVCVLDYAFQLAPAVRALILAAFVTGSALLTLRWLAPAVQQSVRPLSVALLLEDRFPLDDSLASAVDFLEASSEDRLTRFQRVAVVRAENLSKRHNLNEVVPARRAWLAWYASTPDAPCIAICSTAQGDAVCKGCGRTDDEVRHWPALSPGAKRAVWRRIDRKICSRIARMNTNCFKI